MNRIWITLAAGAALALAATAASAQPWRLVATQGERHFVTVDKAEAANPVVLKEAAGNVCKAGKACVVLYWADPAAAASKMPLSKAQSEALVAQFTRNPTTGHEALLLKCQAGAPASVNCLK